MRSVIALLMLALPCAAEVAPQRAQALQHMVQQDCGSCHGLTMKGGLGRPLSAEALAHAEPEGLALIILDGVPGSADGAAHTRAPPPDVCDLRTQRHHHGRAAAAGSGKRHENAAGLRP